MRKQEEKKCKEGCRKDENKSDENDDQTLKSKL